MNVIPFPTTRLPVFITKGMSEAGRRWGLESMLHRHFSSSCQAPAFKHLPSAGGFHAGAESVFSHALSFFGLIDSLWHMCSINDSYLCFKYFFPRRMDSAIKNRFTSSHEMGVSIRGISSA